MGVPNRQQEKQYFHRKPCPRDEPYQVTQMIHAQLVRVNAKGGLRVMLLNHIEMVLPYTAPLKLFKLDKVCSER